PGQAAVPPPPEAPPGGSPNCSPGSIPATYQGARSRPGKPPILYLEPPQSDPGQRSKLDFLQELNRRHLKGREEDSELEARIASYELAFHMQKSAPEAVDLSRETEETKRLYGLDRKETERYGRN